MLNKTISPEVRSGDLSPIKAGIVKTTATFFERFASTSTPISSKTPYRSATDSNDGKKREKFLRYINGRKSQIPMINDRSLSDENPVNVSNNNTKNYYFPRNYSSEYLPLRLSPKISSANLISQLDSNSEPTIWFSYDGINFKDSICYESLKQKILDLNSKAEIEGLLGIYSRKIHFLQISQTKRLLNEIVLIAKLEETLMNRLKRFENKIYQDPEAKAYYSSKIEETTLKLMEIESQRKFFIKKKLNLEKSVEVLVGDDSFSRKLDELIERKEKLCIDISRSVQCMRKTTSLDVHGF